MYGDIYRNYVDLRNEDYIQGDVGCCCIFGSEVKLRFYFWCYVCVQYMTLMYVFYTIPLASNGHTSLSTALVIVISLGKILLSYIILSTSHTL